MCCFATANARDFNLTMLRFIGAQAGLIEPRPNARTHFLAGADAADAFNLEACFTMVAALDGHERVVEVRT